MKIAFVTQPGHAVLPAAGSLEIWTEEVAPRLGRQHDVAIFASRPGDRADTAEGGVSYRFVAHAGDRTLSRLARPAWRLLGPHRPFYASTLHPLSYWVRVGHALRREQFDVAHVFNYSQALPILHRLAPRTKLVLHMQCEWLMQLDERMLARRLALADAILGCSDWITDGTRTRFPAVAARCHTVPNGTDLRALDFERDAARPAKRLLFVGRISPEKGLHVLVDAFDALQRTRPELELVLVGEETGAPPEMLVRLSADPRVRELESFYSGSYGAALQARMSPEGASRVRFTGAVPYAQISQHYRDADVFVFPSMMEAFGMPLAEALAAGLPAVAARTGGIVDIVEDGATGLLVEPGDAGELEAALGRLLDDATLRSSLAARGRAKARARFGWDAVAAETEERFAALVPSGGDSRASLPAHASTA